MNKDFKLDLMGYFIKNQSMFLNDKLPHPFMSKVKAIAFHDTPLSDGKAGYFDIMIDYLGVSYVVKHIIVAQKFELLPLNFDNSFILKGTGDKEEFVKNGLALTEDLIENNFDYYLSNPQNLSSIAISIMMDIPFMEDLLKSFVLKSTR